MRVFFGGLGRESERRIRSESLAKRRCLADVRVAKRVCGKTRGLAWTREREKENGGGEKNVFSRVQRSRWVAGPPRSFDPSPQEEGAFQAIKIIY